MKGSFNIEDYPHVWPPPGFIPVDKNSSAAIVTASNALEVETIRLEVGYKGWIVLAGIQLSEYDVTNAFYTLQRAGQPIRDYGKVTVGLGSPESPAPLYIELLPQQTISLKITNTTGATIAARWRLFGWYYPSRS